MVRPERALEARYPKISSLDGHIFRARGKDVRALPSQTANPFCMRVVNDTYFGLLLYISDLYRSMAGSKC